jgi:hypothetical protein
VSAAGITDWSVACNGPGCPKVVWASALGLYNSLHSTKGPQELREALKDRGWTVDVPEGLMGRRLDFCPDHPKED